MTTPTVSVIIPTYNAAGSVRDAIDSVLAQTRPPTEIIVVDDGSTDDTIAVVGSYGKTIQLLSQARRGPGCARNLGASKATGEWLAFLDADDTWNGHKLETQLERASADVGLVYSDRINFGHLDGLPIRQSDIQPLFEGDVFLPLLLRGNFITTSSVIVREAVFRQAGGFPDLPDLVVAEDWDLWLRVAAGSRIVACAEPLVRYRLWPSGASRDPGKMIRARLAVTSRALATPRGQALGWAVKQRIRSETASTNAWDAARHGRTSEALRWYGRAIVHWPLRATVQKDALKLVLRIFMPTGQA